MIFKFMGLVSLCIAIGMPACALLENKADLRASIEAVTALNNLPIFIKDKTTVKTTYNAVTFVDRTFDYEVGITDTGDLDALRTLNNKMKENPQLIDFIVVTELRNDGLKTFFNLEWEEGSAKIVLIRKAWNSFEYESQTKGYYFSSAYLWAIKASTAWARNIFSPNYFKNDLNAKVEPLGGQGINVCFWDQGLCHTHKYGSRYLGGYDYINDAPIGPGSPDKKFSPLWNSQLEFHGHYLSHLACGPEGVAPLTNVFFDVVYAEGLKRSLVDQGGQTHESYLDTVHADSVGSKHFERTQDKKAFYEEVVKRGVRVLSLSYGTESSSQFALGGALRQQTEGHYLTPSSEALGYLVDHNVAITINAGNNQDKKGPQYPAALASDLEGFHGQILAVGAYPDDEKYNKSNWATLNPSMQKRFVVAPSHGHTSNATPVVAGSLALLMSLGNLSAAQAVEILVETATLLEPKEKYGSGLINLDLATQRVIEVLRHDPTLHERLGVSLIPKVYPMPSESSSASSSTTPSTSSIICSEQSDFVSLIKAVYKHESGVCLGGKKFGITYISNKPFQRALNGMFRPDQFLERELTQANQQKLLWVEGVEGPVFAEGHQKIYLKDGGMSHCQTIKLRKIG